MKLRKHITGILAGCVIVASLSIAVIAASESLNQGGGTWSGGENENGILYSKVVDEKEDGLAFKVTVWVQSDDGKKVEKTGTTSAKGEKGKVEATKASTHKNPFVTEKCGYKNLEVVRVN
ncbi:MAG TPA: hypothetical protein PK566_01800 [Pseudobacteroides sp.]|nr:hypothetical protein [Pseudobacteroides sp.]